MNLLQTLRNKLKRKPPTTKPLLPANQQAGLLKGVEELSKPAPAAPKKPKGRLVKQTRPAEYNPNSSRRGGRIVKIMPRQLEKIKQAQEKVEDDD